MIQYEAYKDSGVEWIGRIPSHWEIIRLKYECSLFGRIGFRGYTNADLVTKDEGAITLSPTNIVDGKMNYDKCSYLSWSKYYESPEIMIFEGDIIFVKTASVGKSALVENLPKEATLNPQFVVFKKIKCDRNLLYWLLQTPIISYQVDNSKVGSTIPTISQEKIGNYILVMPPFSEQQSIATYLDEKTSQIDRIIKSREEKIKFLEELRASIISNAVTKGIRKSVEMKDSGIDWIESIPVHWEVRRLKFLAKTISKGNGITKEEVFPDGDTPCVRYGEIYSKYNGAFEECISKTNRAIHSVTRFFNHGDILFAGTGELIEEIGKNIVYLGGTPCLAGGDIIILEHHQDPIFLNYVLNSKYAQSQKSCGKAKLKVVHISASEIGNIQIALPPLEEQHEIADYLEKKSSIIDEQISAMRSTIEYLKEYRVSLITEVVTGKRKVI